MEKCLHILPMNKLSGAEKMALLICRNLKNYEPLVVCGGDTLADIFRENNIKCFTADFNKIHMLRTVKQLRDIIVRFDVHILHCHDNYASIYGYMTKRLYKLDVKLISHIHNCYPFVKDGGINKLIDERFRDKYDFNIACGSKVYDYYKDNTDYIKDKQISILSNAMDVEGIQEKLNHVDVNIRRKYGIPIDKKLIGYIGRLDEQKGILPFLDELGKKKDSFNDSVFMIVGSGSQENMIKRKVRDLDLENKFIFTGFDTDTYKYYKAFDMFFLPSKYEGLPMVVLEAMASKVPVIAMNVGSIGGLLKDGCGIIVDSGDYKQFVNKLVEFKDNRNPRLVMAERGYQCLKSNYGIGKYVKNLEKIYNIA